VDLKRYVVVHDCGNMLNPLLVEGQIVGGVVHGISNALYERLIYDPSGQPLTTNYGEYFMATAPEMPRIDVDHTTTPSPLNPLGIKGAGEGGTIPALAAIVNAIEDALKPFGVVIDYYPVSPPYLLDLIDRARLPDTEEFREKVEAGAARND
jgi:carbon-monoxide dehydrogenase large subunit